MMDDTKLDEILARLERIEEMMGRTVYAAEQAVAGQSFADRMAAYTRSTRGELPGAG